MNKLKLIIQREFLAKVRNRTFIIMTFLSPILMIGMIALVTLLTKSSIEKKSVVAYVDESGLFKGEDFNKDKSISFENLSEIGLEKAKIIVDESSHEGLLYIPPYENIDDLAINIQFFSEDSPSMITISTLESLIDKKLETEKMKLLDIDLVKLDASRVDVNIKMSNFSGVKSSKLINGLKIGIGMGAGYLIMMFILIYGAMVMRSVIEEKTSRIIEVIISSVKPFQLMLGKIFGTALAGLTQFITWGFLMLVIFIGSSYFFGVDLHNSDLGVQPMSVQEMGVDQMDQIAQNETQAIFNELIQLPLISTFVYFILYFVLGYLLYSSLYAAIGAAVDNETDTQQFMLPIMLPLMLGVYIGFATVINDPHGTIATVFSIVPFTSPIVMLMRIPFGVPIWQILTSLLCLFMSFLAVVWVAAKIYRVGILMYGKKINYKELIKWIRY
ncbi:ABC transporter permease [Lutimonas saemankumensis]|uniref:ABC transporter permease n=1 Tax=Lutimonas saemankumensis TaxID=483016 RepID=UPI001CD41501|nr:ABC transporter permease [Lutimonas saemankumensis]MCA0931991.1 ABC transporter permease [Lutimonas saemankumensis]